MIDKEGIEWLPVAEAARVVRVLPGTIRKWANLGKVDSHKRGRWLAVRMPDVLDAELAWRESGRVRAPTTLPLDKIGS